MNVATESSVDRLKAVGTHRYHDKHPFHRSLVAGTMQNRVEAMLAKYPWIDPQGYAYFRERIGTCAGRCATSALVDR